jgi:drug/metabolite transporter (DMT)-like permease
MHPISRPRLTDWLHLSALTVMWGSAFALTRAAVDQLPPEWVVQGRLTVGAAVLLVWWRLTGQGWPRGVRLWGFFVMIALFGNVIPFSLIAWGQQTIDSGLAGILMAVMPLFTLVLAHYVVPGERLGAMRVVGFVVGLLGVAVLLGPDIVIGDSGDRRFSLAAAAVLGGAFCYAVSAVLSRLRPRSDVVSSAMATTFFGAVVMTTTTLQPATGVEEYTGASVGALGAVALLGVFSTAIAAVVYFRLIERAGPAFVSQLNYLIPVWAVILGGLMFGERPSTTDYLAMAIILLGIALSQLGPMRDAGRDRRRMATEQAEG